VAHLAVKLLGAGEVTPVSRAIPRDTGDAAVAEPK
jgi:hypothetical protein